MSKKLKIQLIIALLFGFFFLGIAIYQWYDLYQIELGQKDGSLSIVLHKVYQLAGKWGVAAVYMPFCIYCFWRAYIIAKLYKNNNEYGVYEDKNDNENSENE